MPTARRRPTAGTCAKPTPPCKSRSAPSPWSRAGANSRSPSKTATTILPLDAEWPAALKRYFGEPAAARDVFRPFYHSYDQ
ncbi:MAG: hypothetical protein LBC18_12395 [Opitutaceae bacterium]|jgi:hypothetical protein|nr:hypothetical protein [Opitutaceae bacterium]